MALCKLTRFGSDVDVWINPKFVIAVDPTDRMGTRITMVTTEHGVPLVIQVKEQPDIVVKRFEKY